jgi:heme-degrading monooxygenase HmoA
MFASITSGQMKPEHINDLVKTWEQLQVERLRHVKGWREAFMLVDRDQRRWMIVGFWASEEYAKAYESSGAFRQDLSRASEFIEGQTSRDVFDVGAHVTK